MPNKHFGSLLSEGITSVAQRWNKTKPGVKWEMTEQLRAEGFPLKDATVSGWCQGFVPKDVRLIAWVSRYCVRRGRVDREWVQSLLYQARYPEREAFLAELFPLSSAPAQGASDSALPGSTVAHTGRKDDPMIPARPVLPRGL